MSSLLGESAKAELRTILRSLDQPVKIVFFTQKDECPACMEQKKLLTEIASMTDMISLVVYDFVAHGDEAISYRVDKVPATVVIGKKDYGIRFYGLMGGYEFSSLIDAVMMASTGMSGLDPRLESLVARIKDAVNIQVMTTLTCPYCPKMVHVALQFAIINDSITASIIDSSEFPHLVQRYDVTGVPKTIINELHSFEGALPAQSVYLEILKAVSPDEYRLIDEAIREAQGLRKVRKADPSHEYETLIVGGGPAGMSAAVYAARKGLDVALIAQKLGGQIGYTASVENYLGLGEISGFDMIELFRRHIERYQIAESIGVNVIAVEKSGVIFKAITNDGRSYTAKSLIFCAGNEYRKLNIPGEDRFLGGGIGFCATCDAPLYDGRRVAVVGGGNSALTAVRDLARFASEIHLIHRGTEFRADEALIDEVNKETRVKFHMPMNVTAFLGKDHLTGVRLQRVAVGEGYDLLVDGVFLEVGLTPNSSPVKDLIRLNDAGEIPVNRDMSTALGGLFAAGDITDTREKQIAISVGQGSQAALSAYEYLFENKLTSIKVRQKEAWQ